MIHYEASSVENGGLIDVRCLYLGRELLGKLVNQEANEANSKKKREFCRNPCR